MSSFQPLIHSTYYLAAPLIIAISITVAGCLIALRLGKKQLKPGHGAFIVAASFIGAVLGAIAGGSSTSLGAALISGVLGVISTLLAYTLSKDSLRDWRHLTTYAIVVLLVSAFLGLLVGANYKAIRTASEVKIRLWQSYFDKVVLPTCEREMELRLSGNELPKDYVSQCAEIMKKLRAPTN